MAFTYELWNTATGNRVGEFESRAEALASVRKTLLRHGSGMVEMLALGVEDDDGEGTVIARGAELAALVQPRTARAVSVTHSTTGSLPVNSNHVLAMILRLVKKTARAKKIHIYLTQRPRRLRPDHEQEIRTQAARTLRQMPEREREMSGKHHRH